MVLNVGEQLVSSYLRYIRKCDFIQTNLYTVEAHGEIDVVGINLKEKQVYICEVAIHLTTGLQYVKDKRPNNVQKLTDKFSRDIEYANKYLSEYSRHFMLWSPLVKDSQGQATYNQLGQLDGLNEELGGVEQQLNRDLYGSDFTWVVGEWLVGHSKPAELMTLERREWGNLRSSLIQWL